MTRPAPRSEAAHRGSRKTTHEIFGVDKALVGMVHLLPLPGSPMGCDSLQKVIDRASREAEMLRNAGFDSLLIENTHDRPYMRRHVGPEVVAAMTAVARVIRTDHEAPLGIQVLAGDNRAAISVALACNAQYIRAEGFVFASVADEGIFEDADAGPLLRYRRQIDAEHIAILADIQKKHSSHAITSDCDTWDHACAADYCLADGLVLTGKTTGSSIRTGDLESARKAVQLPLCVGSGVTAQSAPNLFGNADALIVGSALKRKGDWRNEMEPELLERFENVRP